MLDWCRCVCKRAPGNINVSTRARPLPLFHPRPRNRYHRLPAHTTPRPPLPTTTFLVLPSVPSICFVSSSSVTRVPRLSSLFILLPLHRVYVPLRHPLSLRRTPRDTIGLSLSSRGRHFFHTCRIFFSFQAPPAPRAIQPILIDMGFRLPLTTYVT